VSEHEPRRGVAGEHVVAGGREPFAKAREQPSRLGHAPGGERGDAGLE
jgi:hypothetical protein